MNLFRISKLLFACSIFMAACSNGSSNNNIQMGGAIQGKSLQLSQYVSTIAGTPPGSADGIGTAARFNNPSGITTDGTNLFVVEQRNKTIRKIEIATKKTTTLAGSIESIGIADGTGSSAAFLNPTALTTDGTNLYVTDASTIRKVVIASGAVTTIAGNASTAGATDGTGANASFNNPYAITTDGTNLFVADTGNYIIRKVVIATSEVTTLAGTAGIINSTDGIGTAARFGWIGGITTDGTNLYIADSSNRSIRKLMITTGEVSTLTVNAGINNTVVAGISAWFRYPNGIVSDGTNLFISDSGNRTINKLDISTGILTTLAGNAGISTSTDGLGTAATFNNPYGITSDGTTLFVTDVADQTIRKVAITTGEVSTFAGTASPGSIDGTGPAAKFNVPNAITTDGTNLYVADSNNFTIRKVVIATGAVTTLAGSAGSFGSTDGTGPTAKFGYIHGITTDGTNLYATDSQNQTIRKVVIATGAVSTLAGVAGIPGTSDGMGTTAKFNYPYGITTDGINLFVADSRNHTVRKIVIATGVVTTLAGTPEVSGLTDGTGATARFKFPFGITTDGTRLFVADTGNIRIRKILIATGEVSTLTETITGADLPPGKKLSGSPAPSIVPIFSSISLPAPTPVQATNTEPQTPPRAIIPFTTNTPIGITTDGTNLFITNLYRVRKMEIATGRLTDIAGGVKPGIKDGTGAEASFGGLNGITTDGKNLYMTDNSNTVRIIK